MPFPNLAAEAARFAWPAALALTTVVGTLAAACMLPFVALATISAATLPLGRAAALVAAIWCANQLLGFTLLGYPHDANTLAWGGAIGLASLAALLVARTVLAEGQAPSAARAAGAFALAFVAYELLLFAFAHVAGGLETFTPAIVLRIAQNDALWFAALVALRVALTRAAPRWFGVTPELRLA